MGKVLGKKRDEANIKGCWAWEFKFPDITEAINTEETSVREGFVHSDIYYERWDRGFERVGRIVQGQF